MYQDVTAGGFVAGSSEDGTPVIRNPATRPIMELLDNVLALARFEPDLCFIFHCEFTKQVGKILHSKYKY